MEISRDGVTSSICTGVAFDAFDVCTMQSD